MNYKKEFKQALKQAKKENAPYFLSVIPINWDYTINLKRRDMKHLSGSLMIEKRNQDYAIGLFFMKNHNPQLNVMVDFETLSLKPNAFLLECGLLIFDNNLNIVSATSFTTDNLNFSQDEDVDGSTLQWWAQQKDGLANLLDRGSKQFNPFGNSVARQTINFLERLKRICPNVKFWSKGSFDAEIYKYITEGDTLYKYNDFCDVRTIKMFAEMQGIQFNSKTTATHCAIEDCMAQLEILKQALTK